MNDHATLAMACKVIVALYAVFVVGFIIHTLHAWRQSERLHRLAQLDRVKRAQLKAESKQPLP